jgi:hypothetical protein
LFGVIEGLDLRGRAIEYRYRAASVFGITVHINSTV